MEKAIKKNNLSGEWIESIILLIRGKKVILDMHLAELYNVENKTLKRAVKRNVDRFPPDFMFQLTVKEVEILRYQFGTSRLWGGNRYQPYAFTQEGVAMLSSILRNKRSIAVNIEIMRVFVRMRELFLNNKDILYRLDEMEKKYDDQFKIVFDAIRELVEYKEESKNQQIGFHIENN